MMFVLDTNILSAMMSTRAVPEVAAWIAGQSVDLLFTTSISQAEILSGLAIMPESRRRSDLEAAARAMFMEDFEGRVLPVRHGCGHRLCRYLCRPLAGRSTDRDS
jgi:predicted nucleic acid-binding protein